jgi:hypothetical protein
MDFSLGSKFMKIKQTLIFASLVLLAACSNPENINSLETPDLPEETITLSPSLSPSPTISPSPSSSPTLSPSPSPSPLPSPTPFPPISVSYYHLRVEYITFSDWTQLLIVNAPGILSYSVSEITGNPSTAQVFLDADQTYRIDLNRPPSQISVEPSVSMVVDFAVSADVPWEKMQIVQNKGNWYYSIVRISLVGENETLLIKEFTQYPNHVERFIDLSLLKDATPSEKLIYRSASERMVWAFYYPWYINGKTGFGGWQDHMYTDKPLDLYSSGDYASVENQIILAQSAGIDGFIVSFSGTDDPNSSDCFKNLVEISGKRNFHIAFYIEAGNFGFSTEPGSDAQSQELIEQWLRYIFANYTFKPGYMKVNGKPLIVIYSSGLTPLDTWKSLFAKLEAEGMQATYWGHGYGTSLFSVFDGTHEYGGLTEDGDASSIYSVFYNNFIYSQIFQEYSTPKLWAASVMPGFDNTPMGRWLGWPITIIPRNDGQYYRASFESAIQSNADWIIITSWNEYQENTHIEPSEYYGDTYLNITREYISRYKNPQK